MMNFKKLLEEENTKLEKTVRDRRVTSWPSNEIRSALKPAVAPRDFFTLAA